MQFDKCIKEFENYVSRYDLNVLQKLVGNAND